MVDFVIAADATPVANNVALGLPFAGFSFPHFLVEVGRALGSVLIFDGPDLGIVPAVSSILPVWRGACLYTGAHLHTNFLTVCPPSGLQLFGNGFSQDNTKIISSFELCDVLLVSPDQTPFTLRHLLKKVKGGSRTMFRLIFHCSAILYI